MRRDAFDDVHPFIAFAFFAYAILMTTLFMHPVFIIASFLIGVSWSFILVGKKTFNLLVKFILPVTIIIAIINPIFNHRGLTILFYFKDNPITLESIIYALVASAMFASIIIWFSCFNEIIKSEKIIYIFGKTLPSISLLIMLVLRFIPLYKRQAQKIALSMRARGCDTEDGNFIKRAKTGLSILLALITWGLESSVTTADSMRSRGHGLHGRTFYSDYCLNKRDILILICILIGGVTVIYGIATNSVFVKFYPLFKINELNITALVYSAIHILILFIPIIVNVIEVIAWKYSK